MSETDYPREFALLSQDLRRAHDEIDRIRASLAAAKAENERLKEGGYLLRRDYEHLSNVLEVCKGYADAVTAERDKLLAEREELERQEPVAYSIGNTLHWHKGCGMTNAQLYASPVPAVPECTWTREENGYENGYYDTSCGNAFCINDGTPAENDMKFCPYCGGKLIEVTL